MPNEAAGIVLVVEDDPLVLLSAISIVEDAGYKAIAASDADEAISLLESNPDIRIVFTDIEMPGSMDGMKLAACVRDRWPPIEIILTSGRVPPSEVSLPERGIFLQKPYQSRELVTQLGRMM